MPNSVDEWWSLDGVSLHQYGWAISTFGGSRYDLPTRRGENIQVAYRRGQVHRPKTPDQRTISMNMWLQGIDKVSVPLPATDDGEVIGRRQTINSTDYNDHRQRFNDGWDFLRRLVWKPNGAQVLLTRRWFLTSAFSGVTWGSADAPAGPTTAPLGLPANGVQLITASANAEMTANMAPTMTGRMRAEFAMDFTLADPYFYGTQYTAEMHVDDTIYVWNDGHDTVLDNLIIQFGTAEVGTGGPPKLVNPRLVNTTAEPDLVLKYNGTLAGHTVTVNVGSFTALTNTGANVIGTIGHTGGRHFFGLVPGLNRLRFVCDVGSNSSGFCKVTWRAPYV